LRKSSGCLEKIVFVRRLANKAFGNNALSLATKVILLESLLFDEYGNKEKVFFYAAPL